MSHHLERPPVLSLLVDQIEISELRRFTLEILARASQRLAPSLSAEETELLQKINRGLPPAIERRCRELNAKRRADALTAAEHEELLRLIDQVEAAQVGWLENLAALAQLRGTPLPELMDDLGLRPPLTE